MDRIGRSYGAKRNNLWVLQTVRPYGAKRN